MSPASLLPQDPVQLAWGAAVFLLPGLAAADRLLPDEPLRWLLAPVLSFTLLPVTAIVAGFVLGLPLTPAATALWAVGWSLVLAAPRLETLLDLGGT